MRNNPFRLAITAGVTVACATAALAYDYILNDQGANATHLPIRWRQSSFPLSVLLPQGSTLSDGTNYLSSFQAAVTAWNQQIGSTQFVATTGSGNPTDNNQRNEIAFAAKAYSKDFDTDTLAVTTVWYTGNTRVEADILFNSARAWDSYRGPTISGKVDIRRVALHELGHALGLDHPDEAGQSISPPPIMNSRITSIDALTQDDVEGAQNLYGPPNSPPNDNFANAMIISGSNLTVKGYNTLASRESGEPRILNNAGGRSVWWQWTAPVNGPVTIDTRGSYFDTALAVYTGSALNALTLIAANDDIQRAIVQASEVTFNATANTIYSIAVDGWDGDNAGITLNIAQAGPATPAITTQPVGQSILVGGNATFSVVASNPGSDTLSYQWQFNSADIAGATNTSYNVNNAQLTSAGSYRVVVTNSVGSTISSAAALTVSPVNVPPNPGGGTSGGGNSGGGGGGGGSPSWWFIVALSALGIGRRLSKARR